MDDLNRQVLEGLDAGVILISEGGEVLLANSQAATLLGRDLTGLNLREGDFRDESPLLNGVIESYRRAQPVREPCRDLLVSTWEDGVKYLWVTICQAGGMGRGGGARVVMVQDISEPLTASPAIRKVFSQVNHDLRSPLTSIAGAAELLLSGRVGAVDGVQRRLVRIVEEGTQKMSAILAHTKSDLAKEQQAAGGERLE